MKLTVLVLTIVFCFSQTIFAQKETACRVSAYIADRDPKGLNVRGGAGKDSKVIGAIPFNDDGTMVDIIAANGNWVKISGARNAEGDRTFSKSGWVFAPLLGGNMTGKRPGTVKVFSTASKTSNVVAVMPIETEYKLQTCSGTWMRILLTNQASGESFSGWIAPENQCGNPWTSCS